MKRFRFVAEEAAQFPVSLLCKTVGVTRQGEACVIKFRHVGSGLHSRDGASMRGFEAAGADGEFVRVEATVTGPTEVRVTLSGMPDARLVRFAWADAPEADLRGADDLPATPFVLTISP